jgi:hypothetical protein
MGRKPEEFNHAVTAYWNTEWYKLNEGGNPLAAALVLQNLVVGDAFSSGTQRR